MHANEDWFITNFEHYISDNFTLSVQMKYSALFLTFFLFLSAKKEKKIITKALGSCIYTFQLSTLRNHTVGKEWPSVVIQLYQQGNSFRVVRISILGSLLPSWKKKQIQREWSISYEYASTHKKHYRKFFYFLVFNDQLHYWLISFSVLS